jgi:hypothetical protein
MLCQERLEEFVSIVGAMKRPVLIDRMIHFNGRFPVDFTPDFLSRQSDERLRHIFLAMCLQDGKLPEMMEVC